MRRRYTRCHLNNDPAAEIRYSAAGIIKYSRLRLPSDDDVYFTRRPSGDERDVNSQSSRDEQCVVAPDLQAGFAWKLNRDSS